MKNPIGIVSNCHICGLHRFKHTPEQKKACARAYEKIKDKNPARRLRKTQIDYLSKL